jgi:prepilin signal peptidase PulO-like enzyme (type II secretory pathway)
MDLLPTIDAVALSVSLLFFVVGSISDFKTREVDDKVWWAYGPLGATLTGIRLIIDPSLLLLTGISIGIAFLISMGMFYFGLTGGADAKAIICLGITLPLPPNSWQPLMGFVHPFFPVVVVMMGFICSGLIALWFGISNLVSYARLRHGMFEGLEHEGGMRKAIAFISGYPTHISNLQSKFYLYPMEEITGSGLSSRRTFKFFVDAESDRDKLVSSFLEKLSATGFQGLVWVTPGLPMLFFILIGLAIALVIGDPIFTTILRSVLR